MKVKIIYIVDNLNVGGAQVQLSRLVSGLRREDLDIRVICLGGYTDQLVHLIGLERIYFLNMDCIWKPSFWISYFKLKSILKKERPTIVHTYLNTSQCFWFYGG